jgi:hypothetical protein
VDRRLVGVTVHLDGDPVADGREVRSHHRLKPEPARHDRAELTSRRPNDVHVAMAEDDPAGDPSSDRVWLERRHVGVRPAEIRQGRRVHSLGQGGHQPTLLSLPVRFA